jgi:hypothetical protein
MLSAPGSYARMLDHSPTGAIALLCLSLVFAVLRILAAVALEFMIFSAPSRLLKTPWKGPTFHNVPLCFL